MLIALWPHKKQVAHFLFIDFISRIYILTVRAIGLSLQQTAIQKVLQRERQLQEEEKSRRIQPNGSDDVSIWAGFMQWDKTFDETKDLRVRKINLFPFLSPLANRIFFSLLVDRRHPSSSSRISAGSGLDENQ